MHIKTSWKVFTYIFFILYKIRVIKIQQMLELSKYLNRGIYSHIYNMFCEWALCMPHKQLFLLVHLQEYYQTLTAFPIIDSRCRYLLWHRISVLNGFLITFVKIFFLVCVPIHWAKLSVMVDGPCHYKNKENAKKHASDRLVLLLLLLTTGLEWNSDIDTDVARIIR